MLCAEMVCYYTYIGKTVFQRLQQIYDKYGYVLDKNVSIEYSGLYAMKEMNTVVDGLKTLKIDSFGDIKIQAIRDYSVAKRYVVQRGISEDMETPTCNCVYYELEGGSFVCVRPSGTEPKLKIYYYLKAASESLAHEKLAKLQEYVSAMLEEAKKA
jgi:phosphoglucomutase